MLRMCVPDAIIQSHMLLTGELTSVLVTATSRL